MIMMDSTKLETVDVVKKIFPSKLSDLQHASSNIYIVVEVKIKVQDDVHRTTGDGYLQNRKL